MADKAFKTAIILSAVDRMSTVVNRAFNAADKRLLSFQKRADKVARKAEKIGKKAGAIGLAAAAPIALATKKAIAFEESMADVSKVLNLQQGSAELSEMSNQAQSLGIHLAKAPSFAADLIASLAQGGTAKADLQDIGKFAGEMAVAFGIAGRFAGSSFTKTQNALGITKEQTKAVMNAVNLLSDNMAAEAPQILTFLSQGGAASARMLKITGQEAAALGTTFIAMGKSGSEAGTIMSAMSRGLGKNNQISKLFRKSGGGLQGILAVLKAGNKLSGAKKSAFFSQFGLYGQQVALAAENTELLSQSLGLVEDRSKAADSVAKEFANRSNTRAFEIARLQSQLEISAIKIGNAMLPVISKLAKSLTPMLEKLAVWIDKNPELTAQIVKSVAIFSAMALAISGISFAISGAAKALSFFSAGLLFVTKYGRILSIAMVKPSLALKMFFPIGLKLAKAVRFIALAFRALGLAVMANPIVLIAVAIAGAAYLIWRNWDKLGPFFAKLWSKITSGLSVIWEALKTVPSRFFEAGKNLMSMLWEGMKSMASKPVEIIKQIAQKVRDYLPFSPAKVGPFKDLHRVKIVETIAQSMKPGSAVAAMQKTVGDMATVGINNAAPAGSSASSGNGFTLVFSPNITVGSGSANTADDIIESLRPYSEELLRLVESAMRRKGRTKFS